MGRDWTRKSIEELIDDEVYAMIKSGEIPTGSEEPTQGSEWDSMVTFRHGARVIQRDPVTRIDSRMRLSLLSLNDYYKATQYWNLNGIKPGGNIINEGLIYGHHPGFGYFSGDNINMFIGAELDFDNLNGLKFFGQTDGSNHYTFPWSTPKAWIFDEDVSSSATALIPINVWIKKSTNQLTIFDDVPPVSIIMGAYSLTEQLSTSSVAPVPSVTLDIANPVCFYAIPAYLTSDTNYLENTLFTSTQLNSGCIMLSIPNEYGAYNYNITDDEILKLVYPGQDNITVQHVSLGYGV